VCYNSLPFLSLGSFGMSVNFFCFSRSLSDNLLGSSSSVEVSAWEEVRSRRVIQTHKHL
jgi:hypothetical protein